MNRHDRRAIERRLPPTYRGRRGWERMLDQTPLRISVSGIRGKSGLTRMVEEALRQRGLSTYAKITGTDPVSYKDGVAHAILRDPRKKSVLEETYWEAKKFWPFEAMVLENQAITPYTMRVFNHVYCRPHRLLITNIRHDHLADIARTLPRMAAAFARSAPPGCAIISGERDLGLRKVMRDEAQARDVRFIDASPRVNRAVPGLESITILDALLRDVNLPGIPKEQMRAHRSRLEDVFRWRETSLEDVHWFHGAEINDVDSTMAAINHIQHKRRLPVTMVAYLRRDRTDRTASFIPFFERMLNTGRARKVYLAGHGAQQVAKRMKPLPVAVVEDDVSAVAALAKRLARECRGGGVVTVANAVPPWPRALARALDPAAVPQMDAELDTPRPATLPGLVRSQGRAVLRWAHGTTGVAPVRPFQDALAKPA
jgi:hypothetical protein